MGNQRSCGVVGSGMAQGPQTIGEAMWCAMADDRSPWANREGYIPLFFSRGDAEEFLCAREKEAPYPQGGYVTKVVVSGVVRGSPEVPKAVEAPEAIEDPGEEKVTIRQLAEALEALKVEWEVGMSLTLGKAFVERATLGERVVALEELKERFFARTAEIEDERGDEIDFQGDLLKLGGRLAPLERRMEECGRWIHGFRGELAPLVEKETREEGKRRSASFEARLTLLADRVVELSRVVGEEDEETKASLEGRVSALEDVRGCVGLWSREVKDPSESLGDKVLALKEKVEALEECIRPLL